jgi:CRP/FNR family transcriptional regulator
MSATPRTPDELLRAFPFFAGIDAAMHADLVARATVRAYAKGETLFLDGEPCKGLFIVQSGSVKVYKLNEAGREQIIHIQRAGDPVAELPLFDNQPYPASAAALEDARLVFIARATFEEILASHPPLCRAVITALGMRLRKMVGLVEDLSLRQVRQRLARFLLQESRGREAFLLTQTNEELAARLGSVRDVISRTLSSLQADNLIQLTGRHVRILDREGLEAAS